MTKYFTNIYPEINLYKKPSTKSETVTQMIYGDSFSVSKKSKKWEFDVKKSTASFDMIAETLRATNLGELKVSDTVNYERSTKFGEEIGGHVVSGHVHTTAEICAQEETENNRDVRFRLRDREIVKYILPKGFVAVDGCSLTVGEVAAPLYTGIWSLTSWTLITTSSKSN